LLHNVKFNAFFCVSEQIISEDSEFEDQGKLYLSNKYLLLLPKGCIK